MQDLGAFDPEELLRPVSDDAPCGTDPRADHGADSPYYRAKDTRAAARRIERANDADGETHVPLQEWSEVAELCVEILVSRAKDLEVSTWLIEAMLRLEGFAGLQSGVATATGLVARYWDSIYPQPDEDGFELRLSPFINLNGQDSPGTLMQPLRKIAVTYGETAYQFWQYEQALEISQITDQSRKDARIAGGGLELEQFTLAVQQTPAEFYARLVAEIEASLGALNELSDAFADKVGHDAPPAGALRAMLGTILDAVRQFAGDKLAQYAAASAFPEEEELEQADGEEADGEMPATGPSKGPIANREDALRQLLKVAAYFREHEPHSPISYTLEEIVRRGRMPLPQLLDELIIDANARHYFYLASGLRPPEGGGE